MFSCFPMHILHSKRLWDFLLLYFHVFMVSLFFFVFLLLFLWEIRSLFFCFTHNFHLSFNLLTAAGRCFHWFSSLVQVLLLNLFELLNFIGGNNRYRWEDVGSHCCFKLIGEIIDAGDSTWMRDVRCTNLSSLYGPHGGKRTCRFYKFLQIWTAIQPFTKTVITFCIKFLFTNRFLHKKLDSETFQVVYNSLPPTY